MKILTRFRKEFTKPASEKPRRKLRTDRRKVARGAFRIDPDQPLFQQIKEGLK